MKKKFKEKIVHVLIIILIKLTQIMIHNNNNQLNKYKLTEKRQKISLNILKIML